MTVCFIGHRTVIEVTRLRIKLIETVSQLILVGADTFLFGSKSEFDSLCWEVVTVLKKNYPHIKRVCYNAPHETVFTSKEERQHFENICAKLVGREVRFKDYESAIVSPKSQNATKDTYIMRNQDMIDDSDVCLFYFDKNYLPPQKKLSQKHVADYQPQSGTAIAFAYAQHKKKKIFNLFEGEL